MLFAGAPKMLCAPPPRGGGGGDRYATAFKQGFCLQIRGMVVGTGVVGSGVVGSGVVGAGAGVSPVNEIEITE